MPTKWVDTKLIENEGVLHIAAIANRCGCIFNKVDGSNDIGIDGYIEFTEKEFATGLCIGVQIKSGDSYQTRDKKAALLKATRRHFEYWVNHILPIAGIVYVPEERKSYWVDITQHLLAHNFSDGPFQIPIDKSSVFDEKNFETFYKAFQQHKSSYAEEWNFGRALKGIASFNEKEDRVSALKSLFYYHRELKETWYFIIQQFRLELDADLQLFLILLMRYLISHGDLYWHKDNILSQEIRRFGRLIITTTFTQQDLTKLLSHIDENGISRGTLGQNIYPLIDLIPRKFEYLINIILDRKTKRDQRFWAAIIIINDYQFTDLERAISFAESMIFHFPDSEDTDRFKVIRDTLKEFGFVDFQS